MIPIKVFTMDSILIRNLYLGIFIFQMFFWPHPHTPGSQSVCMQWQ